MTRSYSAALPTAYVALRLLIVLNWVFAIAVLAILGATFVAPDWTMNALGVAPASEIRRLIMPLRAIALLGLLGVPLYDRILRRLVAIVETVRQGDPFVAVNAYRLRTIGWALAGLQILSMIVGAIGKSVSTRAYPINLDAGFSLIGWLAVLLAFVLARVFAEGSLMREDLAGTV